MKSSWGGIVFFGVLASAIGAFAAIGFYEFFLPSFRDPIEQQGLFSLAIVGMYLVALLIATISLSFAVFGRQWVLGLVTQQVEIELSELERRSISRAHSRVAYVLWQLSNGDQNEPSKYLDEAIEITRKCYEDDFDANEDIKVNEINNLAYFLITRGDAEDREEAAKLCPELLSGSKKTSQRNQCLLTYGAVVLACHDCFSDPKTEINRALRLTKSVSRRYKNPQEKEISEKRIRDLQGLKTEVLGAAR